MLIYNHFQLYTKIKYILNKLLDNDILSIYAGGSTNYKILTKSYYPSKDLDLIIVLNNNYDKVKNRLYTTYNKYFNTFNQSTFSSRQIFLDYKDYKIDILFIDNNYSDIKYVTEFRFNGNSEIISAKYKNNLLCSILKSKGYLLELNSIYKYKEYIDVNNTKDIDNIYSYKSHKNNIILQKINNYDWIILFNKLLNLNYNYNDYNSFFIIAKIINNIDYKKEILHDYYNSIINYDKFDLVKKYFNFY